MVVWLMDDDGGFTAGDTATGRTGYAYPTSTHATLACRNPGATARKMMRAAAASIGTPHIVAECDARNWRRINSARAV